jgi:hypothetical protein
MDSLTLILILNTIMWYVIDNLKTNIWGGLSYSRYITIAVAAIASFSLTFGYGLDLVQALSVVSDVTTLGKTITALAMMGGSAVISEIVETLRGQVTK